MAEDTLTDIHRLLIRRLSAAIGRQLNTSADYHYAAECVAERTGQYISPTTLKRLGGYLDEPVATRRTTLDLVSRALGYSDFDDFKARGADTLPDSDPARGNWLDVSTLRRGTLVELTWHPDRRCVIRFLGGDRWEVAESVGTRLQPVQRFHCSHIIAGEPLQILLEPSALTSRPAAYICGRTRGIRFIILNL